MEETLEMTQEGDSQVCKCYLPNGSLHQISRDSRDHREWSNLDEHGKIFETCTECNDYVDTKRRTQVRLEGQLEIREEIDVANGQIVRVHKIKRQLKHS